MSLIEKICFAENIVGIGVNASFLTFMCRKRSLLWDHLNKLLTNILVLHLVDSVVGTCSYFTPQLHRVLHIVHNGFLMEKALTLLLMTFERLYVVLSPDVYHSLLQTHVYGILGGTWFISIISLIATLSSSPTRRQNILISEVATGVLIFVIPVLNMITFFIARNSRQRENRNDRTISAGTRSLSRKFSYAHHAIVVSTMLLLLPCFILNLLYFTERRHYETGETAFEVLIRADCLCDPAIIICFCSDVRKEMVKTHRDVGRRLYRTMTRQRYEQNDSEATNL